MITHEFTYRDFNRQISVSRETFSRLETYVSLLIKWQKSINLVGAATIPHIWDRHIIDSAQLYGDLQGNIAIADVGSGAGLPGLILAIMGMADVTLIERDNRKAAFLREAARATNASVRILSRSIEDIDLSKYKVAIARAYSPLPAALELLSRVPELVFLKGGSYRTELEAALDGWEFDWDARPSITDPCAVVLTVRNCRRKGRRAYG